MYILPYNTTLVHSTILHCLYTYHHTKLPGYNIPTYICIIHPTIQPCQDTLNHTSLIGYNPPFHTTWDLGTSYHTILHGHMLPYHTICVNTTISYYKGTSYHTTLPAYSFSCSSHVWKPGQCPRQLTIFYKKKLSRLIWKLTVHCKLISDTLQCQVHSLSNLILYNSLTIQRDYHKTNGTLYHVTLLWYLP